MSGESGRHQSAPTGRYARETWGDLGMAACGFGGDFDISALWMLEALPQP